MSRSAGSRLFVAVDPPACVRDELAAWARAGVGVAGPRPLAPGLLHITLAFLGAVAPGDVEAVLTEALGCARPVGGLALTAPAWLPPRRPRVLAVDVADRSGELAVLQSEVSAALAGAGLFEPERRRFRPHVTVARMRPGAVAGGPLSEPTPGLVFDGESLTVYRSLLAPSGATYEALGRVALS